MINPPHFLPRLVRELCLLQWDREFESKYGNFFSSYNVFSLNYFLDGLQSEHATVKTSIKLNGRQVWKPLI